MKLVFFDLTGVNYPGGCEKYLATLVKYFSSEYKVTFLESRQYFTFIEYLYHFLSGYKVGSVSFQKRDIGNTVICNIPFLFLVPFTKSYRKVKKLLEDADIVYAKNEFQELAILYYFLGRKKYQHKVVVGVHTAIFVPDTVRGVWKFIHDKLYKNAFYKLFLHSAKYIHVPNSGYVSSISTYYNVSKNKIIYIPYFIDWKTKSPVKQKKRKFTILWSGRLTQQKGLDRLKNIIEQLSFLKIFNNIEFIIAGEGDEKKVITDLVEKYKNIRYLGFIKDMAALYQQADLCIVTSYFETFGYNALEPQSFGIPVVSFNIDGPRDILLQSKTGYLVEDEKEFVGKVCSIFNSGRDEKGKLLSDEEIFIATNQRFSKNNILKKIQEELLIND